MLGSKLAKWIVQPIAMRALLGWERLESGVAFNPGVAQGYR